MSMLVGVMIVMVGIASAQVGLQACSGDKPVTCLFHAWQHDEGPDGFCAATWEDCEVNICPRAEPFLCHLFGRCVDKFEKCAPCPNNLPNRCAFDWSCKANLTECPKEEENPRGALIKVTARGTTGVRLSEIDNVTSPVRERAASYYLSLDNTFWTQKARYQMKMSEYRQVFRHFYYPDRRQLTIPPENLWNFKFDKPRRRTFDGNDFIAVNYEFESYLLGPVSSVAASEPALAVIGGTFADRWLMPVDESLLFQNTGYACMDELDFPMDSVDSENTWVYYDDTCGVETPEEQSCHFTAFPDVSCKDAIRSIGQTRLDIVWERVPWSNTLAKQYRYPANTSSLSSGPDVIPAARSIDDNRIYWRYFPEGSCELSAAENNCIREPGWRHVLTFQSVTVNNGDRDLIVGVPTFPPWSTSGLFAYSSCHNHYHFSHYAEFSYGPVKSRKAAFCVQSTWRWYNNELTSLHSIYGSCAYQGIPRGWGDSYNSGLSCQWIDITDAPSGTHTLQGNHNPENFICEGFIETNSSTGLYVFKKTKYTNVLGEPEFKPACNRTLSSDSNNKIEIPVYNPENGGTLVTSVCSNHQFGPRRNCGFSVIDTKRACTPGQPHTLHLQATSSIATTVRICEFSIVQNVALPCEFNYAVDWTVIEGQNVDLTFTCPGPRDAKEVGGFFSILSAPVLEADPFFPPKIIA